MLAVLLTEKIQMSTELLAEMIQTSAELPPETNQMLAAMTRRLAVVLIHQTLDWPMTAQLQMGWPQMMVDSESDLTRK